MLRMNTLGGEIAAMARRSGISQAELGKRSGWSRQQISALIRGTRNPKKEQIAALDEALGANGALLRRWASDVGRADIPDWFREIAILERTASEIVEYQPLVVPGLLQTDHYAAASLGAGALAPTDLDSVVRSRLERRTHLLDGVRLRFLVAEEAVRATVGTAEIMSEQLTALVNADVNIGVLPREMPQHPARVPPFRLMSFPDRPRLGYVEHLLGGDLVDAPDDLATLEAIMSALLAEALPRAASAELLRQVGREFDGMA